MRFARSIFRLLQPRGYCAHRAYGNAVLQIKNVFQSAVEAVRPQMRSGQSIDKLPSNAHVVPRFPHAPFEDMRIYRTPNSRPTCFTSTARPL